MHESRSKPTIPEVLDMEAWRTYPVHEIFARADKTHHQQRMADETALLNGMSTRYHCPLCHAALSIRALTNRTFYFRHPNDPDAECPYRYDHNLSLEQITAIKYDGARESRQHKKIKHMLEVSLTAARQVTPGTVFAEKTVRNWDGDWKTWRRPDVQADVDGRLYAFEIQLSTTFLTVIAGRRDFYQRQGGLLFWIFDEKFLCSGEMRFTERDVFYNNNCNLFYLSDKTVARSVECKDFRLMCRWEEPEIQGESIGGRWNEKEVSLSDLTIDYVQQRVFYFDYDAKLAEAESKIEEQKRAAAAEVIEQRRAQFEARDAIQYEDMLRERASQTRGSEEIDFHAKNFAKENNGLAAEIAKIKARIEQQARQFRMQVLTSYGIPKPEINTVRNFESFWIKAALEADPIPIHEAIWYHYHQVFMKECTELVSPLPAKLPWEYRQLLCALYSLREGEVIGTKLENFRALENHIYSSYRLYYRYFLHAVKCYSREHEVRVLEQDSTAYRHVQQYKENRGQVGFVQHSELDPLVGYLFPELAEAMTKKIAR